MILVFVFRDILIQVIFTEAFLGMSILFKWQLAGDFVRFIANVLSYQFLAKKEISSFISTQIIGLVMYYFFGRYFLSIYGTEGVVIALFVSNLIYLGVVLFVLRTTFFGANKDI